MSEPFSTRWSKRHEFAEVAETLGVRTDQVMAMLPGEVVLYTPGDDDETICSAHLVRRSDGVLVATDRQRHPEMLAQIKANIESALRDKLGPP